MNAILSLFVETSPAMPLFALSITIGAYLLGVLLQRRAKNAFVNPVLFAILMVGVTLRLLKISYASYFAGAQLLNFLLGPAVVALAIPLVRAMRHIRLNLWPMGCALLAGSVTSMVSGYALVRVLGGDQILALSMLPKAVTTPIAIEVAHAIGGIPSLTAVLAILSGILVAVSINCVTRWMGVHDPSAVGLAAGVAGSGIGASRVIAQHSLSAAFSAVAIGLNGLVTGALAPVMARLLKNL